MGRTYGRMAPLADTVLRPPDVGQPVDPDGASDRRLAIRLLAAGVQPDPRARTVRDSDRARDCRARRDRLRSDRGAADTPRTDVADYGNDRPDGRRVCGNAVARVSVPCGHPSSRALAREPAGAVRGGGVPRSPVTTLPDAVHAPLDGALAEDRPRIQRLRGPHAHRALRRAARFS